jgi:transcriptional regulator with XRE-family HTH domain
MIDQDSGRRQRLGAFLRAHRERLSTEGAGLPATRRRRTAGLRREEVAQLAGISTTWYVRIEQGREVSASAAALNRLARALQLGAAERAHLFTLAERRDPLAGVASGDEARLGTLQRMVSAISVPAYVLDRRWNARAWNDGAARLFQAWLGAAQPNLLRYVFLDPDAHGFIVDWADRARRLVAECRADLARQRDDADTLALVAELRDGSADFARWWDEQHVLDPEGGLRRFRHPQDGALAYEQVNFLPMAAPGFRLVGLLPGGT